MSIKTILDEISAEPGTNAKIDIFKKHVDNELLKSVLYQAMSKRVKFYIKQIPEFQYVGENKGLEWAINELSRLSSREFTGGAAINHLQYVLGSINVDDQYVIIRIIEKDLKIGMGRTNVNKVIESLVEKTPYMGAKSYSKKLIDAIMKKKYALSQIKMDGRYANAIVRDEEVGFESRAGEPNGLHDAQFLKELSTLGDELVFNGELTVIGVPVRRTANGIVSSLVDIQFNEEKRGPIETQKKIDAFLKKHASDFGNENITFQEALDSVVYTCWDVITVDEYYNKKSSKPYEKRFEQLKSIIEDKNPSRIEVVETRVVKTVKEAMEHFVEALERGLEGTILKDAEGAWKDGKPNWQVKLKLEMSIDLKIVGFQYGNEGTKNENIISTLLVESSCGLLKTNPSGMDEKMMQHITDNQEELLGTIVEIRCCGLSQDKSGNWSTLHPSVIELRSDKDTCDSLESAKEIENMAKGLKKDV